MARTKVTVKTPDFSRWQKALNGLTTKTGEAVEAQARATAPRSEGEANSNHYMDNINYYSDSQTVIAENKYSAAIEYGFDNYEETVNEHERVITQAFGKPITPVVATVKTHTRTMNRTPNPVMRNAAAKVQKEIPQIWRQAQKENGL